MGRGAGCKSDTTRHLWVERSRVGHGTWPWLLASPMTNTGTRTGKSPWVRGTSGKGGSPIASPVRAHRLALVAGSGCGGWCVHMVQPGRRVVGHPVLLYVLLLLLESQPNVWQAKSEFGPIAERIFVCIELACEMALNGHL